MCDMLYMNAYALFDAGIETIFGVTCELISWFVDVFIHVIEYEWILIYIVENDVIRRRQGVYTNDAIRRRQRVNANDEIRRWGRTRMVFDVVVHSVCS